MLEQIHLEYDKKILHLSHLNGSVVHKKYSQVQTMAKFGCSGCLDFNITAFICAECRNGSYDADIKEITQLIDEIHSFLRGDNTRNDFSSVETKSTDLDTSKNDAADNKIEVFASTVSMDTSVTEEENTNPEIKNLGYEQMIGTLKFCEKQTKQLLIENSFKQDGFMNSKFPLDSPENSTKISRKTYFLQLLLALLALMCDAKSTEFYKIAKTTRGPTVNIVVGETGYTFAFLGRVLIVFNIVIFYRSLKILYPKFACFPKFIPEISGSLCFVDYF